MDDPRQPNNELLDLPESIKRDPATNKAEYMKMSDTEELNETKSRARLKPIKANSQTKVKKAKPAKEAKTTKGKTKVVKDQYGLRKGSARSEAATMYARKAGATLAEVKERVGSIQLNVLATLEERGYTVEKIVETPRKGKRTVTRYKLRAKTV